MFYSAALGHIPNIFNDSTSTPQLFYFFIKDSKLTVTSIGGHFSSRICREMGHASNQQITAESQE